MEAIQLSTYSLSEFLPTGALLHGSNYLYSAAASLLSYDVCAAAYSLVSSSAIDESLAAQDALYRKVCSEGNFEAALSMAHDTNQLFLVAGCGPKEAQIQSALSLIDPSVASALHPLTRLVDLVFVNVDSLHSGLDFHVLLTVLGYRTCLVAPVGLAIQVGLAAVGLLLFAIVYISLFSTNREEWQADVDFTVSSLSAEAEKELFSIDDATSLCLTLFFFFGVYFGFFLVNSAMTYSEALSIALPVPIVVGSLVLVPVNLVVDFGLLFVAYLRGASNTSSLFFELVYDYIGVVAFFTRLVVQFVRIVLMAVVYIMMHETVVFNYVPLGASVAGDSFAEELGYLRPSLDSITFFLVMALPARIGY